MTSGNPRASAIFHLLAHAEQAVTAAALATAISASERTVKKEMAAVRVLAAGSGAQLLARRGRGYWLQIVDQGRFDSAVEQLDITAGFRGRFGGAASRARTRELLSRLLLAEDYLKVDDIAEEMFVSRSALRPDLRGVRSVLSGFGLQLDDRPYSGVRITGPEFGVRLCLTHLFESAFHRTVPTLAQGVVPIDPTETSGLRQDLLRVLRASPVRVSDIRTQRMAQYLALSAVRVRAGHTVEADPRLEELLPGLPQLDVARDVMTAATQRTGVGFSPAEASALAVLILMWTDVEGRTEHLRRYGALGTAALQRAELIHRDLVECFGVDLFGYHTAQTSLAAGIVPVLVRLHAGLWAAEMYVGNQAESGNAESPMALAIARRAASLLSAAPPLATDAIVDLAGRVTVAIDAVQHTYVPRRIALCSGRGLDAAAHLRNEILDHYPADRYFAAADTFELYELRGVDSAAYDAVVFDGAPVGYRYEWPVVFLGRPIDRADLQRFHDVVIQPGFGFARLIEVLGVQSVPTFRGVRARSTAALAAMIGFRLGDNKESAADLEEQVLRAFDTSLFGRVCAIMIPRVHPGRNRVEIYELDAALQDGENEIRYVVVCAVNFDGDNSSLRLFDELTGQLVRDANAIGEVMNSESFARLLPTVASRAR